MQIQGTPGRLNDFVEGKEVSLSNVSKLVVDEADRMLDMGLLELVSEGVAQDQGYLFWGPCRKDHSVLAFIRTSKSLLDSPCTTWLRSVNPWRKA